MNGLIWFALGLLVLRGLYALSDWVVRETIAELGSCLSRALASGNKGHGEAQTGLAPCGISRNGGINGAGGGT
jgi:hypothetical protein